MVTTAGQVVDPSGAMTGGGNAAALTASKNKRAMVAQAEKDIAKAQEEYDKAAARFENIRNQKNELVGQKDSLERSLEHFAVVISNRDEVDQLRVELEAEQARVASIVIPKLTQVEHEQVRQVGLKIQALDASLKPHQEELNRIESEIEIVTQKIMAKAGEKTKRQKDIVDDLRESLEGKKKELAR